MRAASTESSGLLAVQAVVDMHLTPTHPPRFTQFELRSGMSDRDSLAHAVLALVCVQKRKLWKH